MTPVPRPLVLCILDGWGWREDRADNAILEAAAPHWRHLLATCPHSLIEASELYVGLPRGQMGNSEVGHMNIGAGRVVMQELPRIDAALDNGELGRKPAMLDFIKALKSSGGTAHLMGLLSPGGVHSHQDHMLGLARLLAAAGIKVAIHAFLDGRDTPPRSAGPYLKKFMSDIKGEARIHLASIGGRYYAMDRDQRWERVERAWRALVMGEGARARDWESALRASYERGESDEFVAPTVLDGTSPMKDGDGVVMVNFRADRVREILASLLDPDFKGFTRPAVPRFAAALGTAEYSQELTRFMKVLFPPSRLEDGFGEVVARAHLTQLRIAETEKYAHVTFFFNGGRETQFPGESRILVPSPKVATYDMKPEMSAPEVTDKLVEAIAAGRFDVIIVNYANADMVGHTGDLAAAVKAVEAVDHALGRLEAAVRKAGGVLLITADHGNAEMMRDPETGEPHTAHTLNPVPLVLVNPPAWITGLDNGKLADLAPTALALLGLEKPAAMTGHALARGTLIIEDQGG
ncbi:MAG TPA: 2,3-bisphosphoglycerate-independent phosphoglycerate mutase [Stellaceae bacterium]|nr:2,3-bisphosphoglycerate-independent phosphoglycerate mutase [Stellaceae bacterium]